MQLSILLDDNVLPVLYALITVCFSTLVFFLFLVLLQILYTLLYRLATAS